jgi:hypothetical protein
MLTQRELLARATRAGATICAPMNEVDTHNKLFRDRTSKGGGR